MKKLSLYTWAKRYYPRRSIPKLNCQRAIITITTVGYIFAEIIV